jgi:hypothetical protein
MATAKPTMQMTKGVIKTAAKSFSSIFSPPQSVAIDTGRKNYNFPTSHHTTTKTQTLTPTASNTGITAALISPNPPQRSR